MKYMLLLNYAGGEGCDVPMDEWPPEDITAHIEFQHRMNQELIESGELVDMQGLSGPERAKTVISDGTTAPVVTDGPYPEYKELLAGYRIVDVESEARAIEIAAQMSAAPAIGGAPIKQPIEVRAVMSAPAQDV